MPDRDDRTTEAPPPRPAPGLADPRAPHPGPEDIGPATGEAPDQDTPAWEGPDPAEEPARLGLVDPRSEIPGRAGS